MSLALTFLGGAPFQLLYDGVQDCIKRSGMFRTLLQDLEYTLDCLQPQILQQIRDINLQLNLPADVIQDLQTKMEEGIVLLAELSKLSMWNIRIWGNCCDCIEPNYAQKLAELDRSLRRLRELLRLEEMRNVSLLLRNQENLQRRLSDVQQSLQNIQENLSRSHQQVIQAVQVKHLQQRENGGGVDAAPALGVVYGTLLDAVTQVKVKNLLFKRFFGEFKCSLDFLHPLIREIAEGNKVIHLPKHELKNLIIQMEKGVELVHKCSKVRKYANYKKCEYTNELLRLDESLQRLFVEFKGQVERNVKEVMDSVSNIEAVMEQIEGDGVVQIDELESESGSIVPNPGSPIVGMDEPDTQGPRDGIKESTLMDSMRIIEEGVNPSQVSEAVQHQMETEGLDKVLPEPPSLPVELSVLHLQEPVIPMSSPTVLRANPNKIVSINPEPRPTDDLSVEDLMRSYQAACKVDADLQSFDTNLQTRTNQVINTLAAGVEVRGLSFDSLKEVTEYLLEMTQEVVKVTLECWKDIWKNQKLFKLVKEYFEHSSPTLDFCTALEEFLKRAPQSRVHILVALQQFEEENELGGSRYTRTLEKLKNFKASGDRFNETFFQMFQYVYRKQLLMLEKLQLRKNVLDKKLEYIKPWRKVSSIIFVTTFAAVLICSVVAAAMAGPPVAEALTAATSIPIGSMGKWIDLMWKYKGQKDVISSMQVGAVVIKDLYNIRVLIDRLEIEIESLLDNASFAIEQEAVRIAIEEIKKKLGVFMKNAEDLGTQVDRCSRDIRRARTVVLQRIIKHTNN